MFILTVHGTPTTIEDLYEHEKGAAPSWLDPKDGTCYIACKSKEQVKEYYENAFGSWDERSPTVDVSRFDVLKP